MTPANVTLERHAYLENLSYLWENRHWELLTGRLTRETWNRLAKEYRDEFGEEKD